MGETFAPARTPTAHMYHLSIVLSLKTIQRNVLSVAQIKTAPKRSRRLRCWTKLFSAGSSGLLLNGDDPRDGNSWHVKSTLHCYIYFFSRAYRSLGFYSGNATCLAFWLQLLHVKWHLNNRWYALFPSTYNCSSQIVWLKAKNGKFLKSCIKELLPNFRGWFCL